MKTNKSFCSILGKNGLVFCAFLHQIVFGKVENDDFVENQYFEFSLNKICELFCAFFNLIKAITNKNFKANGLLCLKDTCQYQWKLHQENDDTIIILSIECNQKTTLQLNLTICDFNDVILLVSHLILPCLNLKDKETFVIQNILTLDLDQLLKLKNDKAIHVFLKNHEKEFDLTNIEAYNCTLLISYHLDVIVAIHNVKSLYNSDICIMVKNIEIMLSCSC